MVHQYGGQLVDGQPQLMPQGQVGADGQSAMRGGAGAAASDRNQDVDNGQKSKRRSKNDTEGRDFKCSFCEKTYLSYPALYTHMKHKHSTGADGEARAPPNTGRGRGRPRKNVSRPGGSVTELVCGAAVSADGPAAGGVLPVG